MIPGASSPGRHVLLLAGAPGVGKTTLLRGVSRTLTAQGGPACSGFTTEEIREKGQRVGFRIIPFHGRGRIMAYVGFAPKRVGRYGVDVTAIDAVARTTLSLVPEVSLYLVDEIGSMECLSETFVGSMRTLLDSDRRVVATIGRARGGFITEAKSRRDVELWEVTTTNRDALVAKVLDWIGSRPPTW